MAIPITDIKFLLTGGASNTNPNLSLGGVTNTASDITTAIANNLWDHVLPAEGTAGATEYRFVAIRNGHATETALNMTIFMAESASTFTTFAIGLETGAPQTLLNETATPVGIIFTSPLTVATGLSVGNLAAGSEARLCIRRIVTAGAPGTDSDFPSFFINYDST
jgi:hypothetical protein